MHCDPELVGTQVTIGAAPSASVFPSSVFTPPATRHPQAGSCASQAFSQTAKAVVLAEEIPTSSTEPQQSVVWRLYVQSDELVQALSDGAVPPSGKHTSLDASMSGGAASRTPASTGQAMFGHTEPQLGIP